MTARKEPNGVDLLALLIDLLAEQEGVKISYEIVGRDKNKIIHKRRNTHEQHQRNP